MAQQGGSEGSLELSSQAVVMAHALATGERTMADLSSWVPQPSPAQLQAALAAAFTGANLINNSNVSVVLSAARSMGLSKLQELCLQHIRGPKAGGGATQAASGLLGHRSSAPMPISATAPAVPRTSQSGSVQDQATPMPEREDPEEHVQLPGHYNGPSPMTVSYMRTLDGTTGLPLPSVATVPPPSPPRLPPPLSLNTTLNGDDREAQPVQPVQTVQTVQTLQPLRTVQPLQPLQPVQPMQPMHAGHSAPQLWVQVTDSQAAPGAEGGVGAGIVMQQPMQPMQQQPMQQQPMHSVKVELNLESQAASLQQAPPFVQEAPTMQQWAATSVSVQAHSPMPQPVQPMQQQPMQLMQATTQGITFGMPPNMGGWTAMQPMQPGMQPMQSMQPMQMQPMQMQPMQMQPMPMQGMQGMQPLYLMHNGCLVQATPSLHGQQGGGMVMMQQPMQPGMQPMQPMQVLMQSRPGPMQPSANHSVAQSMGGGKLLPHRLSTPSNWPFPIKLQDERDERSNPGPPAQLGLSLGDHDPMQPMQPTPGTGGPRKRAMEEMSGHVENAREAGSPMPGARPSFSEGDRDTAGESASCGNLPVEPELGSMERGLPTSAASLEGSQMNGGLDSLAMAAAALSTEEGGEAGQAHNRQGAPHGPMQSMHGPMQPQYPSDLSVLLTSRASLGSMHGNGFLPGPTSAGFLGNSESLGNFPQVLNGLHAYMRVEPSSFPNSNVSSFHGSNLSSYLGPNMTGYPGSGRLDSLSNPQLRSGEWLGHNSPTLKHRKSDPVNMSGGTGIPMLEGYGTGGSVASAGQIVLEPDTLAKLQEQMSVMTGGQLSPAVFTGALAFHSFANTHALGPTISANSHHQLDAYGGASSAKMQRKMYDRSQCQVDGCQNDLRNLKEYYQRYRICDLHLKMGCMWMQGKQVRFCQQCGRFHELSAFEGDHRSCRERLEKHNARRRRAYKTSTE